MSLTDLPVIFTLQHQRTVIIHSLIKRCWKDVRMCCRWINTHREADHWLSAGWLLLMMMRANNLVYCTADLTRKRTQVLCQSHGSWYKEDNIPCSCVQLSPRGVRETSSTFTRYTSSVHNTSQLRFPVSAPRYRNASALLSLFAVGCRSQLNTFCKRLYKKIRSDEQMRSWCLLINDMIYNLFVLHLVFGDIVPSCGDGAQCSFCATKNVVKNNIILS